MFLKKIFWFTTAILVLAVVGSIYIGVNLFGKVDIKGEKIVMIPNNATNSQAVSILAKEGALRPEWLFKGIVNIYTTLRGQDIKPGKYKLTEKMNSAQTLKAIFTGKQAISVKVTFPEGIRYKKFAEICADKLGIDEKEFMSFFNNDSILTARKIDSPNLEGYLMPDTYEIMWNESPRVILDMLLDQQDKIWDEYFSSQAKDLKLSRNYALTLASIIESEAKDPDERPKIAGVYKNRLNLEMKLEADPTVQYALGDKKRVTYNDLKIDSRYNTYKYAGLPPGPINSPSKSSISAALNPEKHNYIYFVKESEDSPNHVFSATAKKHEAAVREYRKSRTK